MRYPYEKFLRFLVSRRANIKEVVSRHGLPQVGDLWVARARSDIRRNAPFEVKEYLNKKEATLRPSPSIISWAEEEGIAGLWRAQPEFGGMEHEHLYVAHRLFADTRTRGILAMLTMSAVSDDSIVETLQEKFDADVPRGAIDLYRSIFWDCSQMGTDDWEIFLPSISNNEERHFIALGLRGVSEQTVADALSVDSPVIDYEFVINQIVARSYEQFRNAVEHPTPDLHSAREWASLALNAIKTAKVAVTSNDDTPISAGFVGLFSVQPTSSKHPTIADLAGEVGLPSRKTKEGS